MIVNLSAWRSPWHWHCTLAVIRVLGENITVSIPDWLTIERAPKRLVWQHILFKPILYVMTDIVLGDQRLDKCRWWLCSLHQNSRTSLPLCFLQHLAKLITTRESKAVAYHFTSKGWRLWRNEDFHNYTICRGIPVSIAPKHRLQFEIISPLAEVDPLYSPCPGLTPPS